MTPSVDSINFAMINSTKKFKMTTKYIPPAKRQLDEKIRVTIPLKKLKGITVDSLESNYSTYLRLCSLSKTLESLVSTFQNSFSTMEEICSRYESAGTKKNELTLNSAVTSVSLFKDTKNTMMEALESFKGTLDLVFTVNDVLMEEMQQAIIICKTEGDTFGSASDANYEYYVDDIKLVGINGHDLLVETYNKSKIIVDGIIDRYIKGNYKKYDSSSSDAIKQQKTTKIKDIVRKDYFSGAA